MVNLVFIGVVVRDLDSSRLWYEMFFGRSPDVLVNDHEVMWKVTESSWLYVLEDASSVGQALVSVSVDDLDEAVKELLERGLEPNEIEIVPAAGRKAHFIDRDGNVASLIQINV